MFESHWTSPRKPSHSHTYRKPAPAVEGQGGQQARRLANRFWKSPCSDTGRGVLRSSINGTKIVWEPAQVEGTEGSEMTCCAERNVRRGRWRLGKEEKEEYGEMGSAVVKVEQGASHSTHRGQPKKSMQTKHRSTFRNIIAMPYRFFFMKVFYKTPTLY